MHITVDMVIFSGVKICENVGKTFYVGILCIREIFEKKAKITPVRKFLHLPYKNQSIKYEVQTLCKAWINSLP